MGELAKWAKNNSPFLKIGMDEVVEVVFLGWKEVEDNRNPGQFKVRYEVEWNKQTKWFESAAGAVAMQMDKVKVGDIIRIKKTLVSGKNRYQVYIGDEEEEIEEE